MKIFTIETKTGEETKSIGKKLASLLNENSVLLLEGELGTGKTTLTQGIAEGLNIHEPITSPTFTIIKEYMGDFPLYHIDAYRLEFSEEDLGFEEYFTSDGITVVEWPQFIESFLPNHFLRIKLQYKDESKRQLVFEPLGEKYETLISESFLKGV